MESKQHRSRIVMMADDVTKMLSDCNAVVTSAMPEREPFFPNSEGGFYGKRGLEKTFRLVLKQVLREPADVSRVFMTFVILLPPTGCTTG